MFFRKIKEGNPFELPSHNTTCVFRGLVYNLHINPHQLTQRVINGIYRVPVTQVGHPVLAVILPVLQRHAALIGNGVCQGSVVGLTEFLPQSRGVFRLPLLLGCVGLAALRTVFGSILKHPYTPMVTSRSTACRPLGRPFSVPFALRLNDALVFVGLPQDALL